MSDCYYELVDARRRARREVPGDGSDAARGRHRSSTAARRRRCWSARCERCEQRDDTRLSRVVVDLLGPIPVEDELWMRATSRAPGKQIELVSAEMLALGPDGPTAAGRPRQRMAPASAGYQRCRACGGASASAVDGSAQPQFRREVGPQLSAQPRLEVADQAAQRRSRRVVDQADGGSGQRRDHDTAGAVVRRRRQRQRHRHQAGHHASGRS